MSALGLSITLRITGHKLVENNVGIIRRMLTSHNREPKWVNVMK